ncbi:hypothetical protein DYB26_015707, partial [Aphanomyces astaci]
SQSSMVYTDKRRNWSQEDDLTLLKQVAADTPFAAEKGQLRKAWQGLAETLMSCENFGRVVDGKKEEKEKHMLLDDIITLLDDVKADATRFNLGPIGKSPDI